ncbi:hypothetical protein Cgig2_009807 [Carnegiea gigantea]|uniref:Uncharacterized protein n=1 Tax=Carnegiea gigantea TaxID=171969 RepID=A0A9Q1JQ14_9CARY|nr:hypothetical protein Cgig2_009807 [Carnegiea gigantea]
MAGRDPEKLTLVSKGIKHVLKKVKDLNGGTRQSKLSELESFIGSSVPDQIDILQPKQRNIEGSGKRIKGRKEKAIKQQGGSIRRKGTSVIDMEEDGNLGFNIRVYTYTNINCLILIILVSMLKHGEKKEISLPMAGSDMAGAGKGGATSRHRRWRRDVRTGGILRRQPRPHDRDSREVSHEAGNREEWATHATARRPTTDDGCVAGDGATEAPVTPPARPTNV